jgi:hypothetical protein
MKAQPGTDAQECGEELPVSIVALCGRYLSAEQWDRG